jgi:SAM-dependent methyltransferase
MDWTAYILEDQERMSKARNYFAWQSRLAQQHLGQRVIDVGCGIGNFTGLLLDRELVIAVDIEPRCIERLEQHYPDRDNLVPLVCDAGSREFRDLAACHPDSCVCLNVLEHIENDVAALENIASVLPRGGHVVLLVPAFEALYGPTDENLGHYRRYGRSGLCKVVRRAGLRIKNMHYLNLAGFFGWWTNSHVLRRDANSEKQIEFFDHVVVPLASRLERFVYPPFGQSLFAVLEKR